MFPISKNSFSKKEEFLNEKRDGKSKLVIKKKEKKKKKVDIM